MKRGRKIATPGTSRRLTKTETRDLVIKMREELCCSSQEIAETLNISRGTVIAYLANNTRGSYKNK